MLTASGNTKFIQNVDCKVRKNGNHLPLILQPHMKRLKTFQTDMIGLGVHLWRSTYEYAQRMCVVYFHGLLDDLAPGFDPVKEVLIRYIENVKLYFLFVSMGFAIIGKMTTPLHLQSGTHQFFLYFKWQCTLLDDVRNICLGGPNYLGDKYKAELIEEGLLYPDSEEFVPLSKKRNMRSSK